jgi:hypothetical protein
MTMNAMNSSTDHRWMLLKKWPTGLVCRLPIGEQLAGRKQSQRAPPQPCRPHSGVGVVARLGADSSGLGTWIGIR